MKFAEFQELCRKEWQEYHGDIHTLWLTEESYRELNTEAILARELHSVDLQVHEDFRDRAPGRPVIGTLRNPVTKSPVRMKLCRDRDVADIYNGNTRQLFTKVL